MKTSDTLLVGWEAPNGTDAGFLIVARKRPNHTIEIIKAIPAPEAVEIYKKLVGEEITNAQD